MRGRRSECADLVLRDHLFRIAALCRNGLRCEKKGLIKLPADQDRIRPCQSSFCLCGAPSEAPPELPDAFMKTRSPRRKACRFWCFSVFDCEAQKAKRATARGRSHVEQFRVENRSQKTIARSAFQAQPRYRSYGSRSPTRCRTRSGCARGCRPSPWSGRGRTSTNADRG
jgi:hypothetical protein